MGKPTASATTTYESTSSDQCSPCMTGSMIWRTAKAAIPYPTRARMTRRRFNSEMSAPASTLGFPATYANAPIARAL